MDAEKWNSVFAWAVIVLPIFPFLLDVYRFKFAKISSGRHLALTAIFSSLIFLAGIINLMVGNFIVTGLKEKIGSLTIDMSQIKKQRTLSEEAKRHLKQYFSEYYQNEKVFIVLNYPDSETTTYVDEIRDYLKNSLEVTSEEVLLNGVTLMSKGVVVQIENGSRGKRLNIAIAKKQFTPEDNDVQFYQATTTVSY